MFKAFNSKQLTNNKHIILGSREKQHLLFSLVHLILCYVLINTKNRLIQKIDLYKLKFELLFLYNQFAVLKMNIHKC